MTETFTYEFPYDLIGYVWTIHTALKYFAGPNTGQSKVIGWGNDTLIAYTKTIYIYDWTVMPPVARTTTNVMDMLSTRDTL